MRRRALVVVALLQAVVFRAGAAEFIPSWDAEGVWDSNVFNSSQDQESDFSVRTGPTLRVREPQGDLVYDLSYWLRYEAYARIQGANGIDSTDQYFSGRGSWRVTPTTTVSATDYFAFTSNINALSNTGLISTVTVGRDRITTNDAEATLTHQLGPLWQLVVSAGNQLYDFRDPQQSDTTATTGTLQLTRAFSPRLIAGVGGQIQRQEFAGVRTTPDRGTTLYQAFGVVNYKMSPTWRISARAGPAYVMPDALTLNSVRVNSYYAVNPNTCPKRADGTPVFIPFAQSSADRCSQAVYRNLQGNVVAFLAPSTTVTDVPFVGDQNVGNSLNYFGTLTIEKEWRQWRGSLSYSRSASNSSGLNAATVLDELNASVTWAPSPLWDLHLDAIYSIQTALNEARQTEVALAPRVDAQVIQGQPAFTVFGVPFEVDTGNPIKNELDITTYYFTLSGRRRITPRLSLIGAATFRHQESGGFQQNSQVQDFEVSIGFTWKFDPIPL